MRYTVNRAKHNGTEDKTFKLKRPGGTGDYLFLHFKSPVVFTLFDEIYNITPGMCILLSPGTPHGFYPENCTLVHDWIHFIPSDEAEFLKLKIDINTFFVPVDTSFITASVRRVEHELIYRDEFYSEFISSELERMLIRLKRQMRENLKGHHSEMLKKLRLEIYHNPTEFSGVSDMAEYVNLSRSRFTVLYKEFFGVSPNSDMINARVSKASYLLSLGTLSLTEISDICGYQSIYHFIRQFRNVVGVTPGKYRRD